MLRRDGVEQLADGGVVGDVEDLALDAVLRGDRVQQVLTAARDDHLVAGRVESARELEADARGAPGHEDGVARHVHLLLSFGWME